MCKRTDVFLRKKLLLEQAKRQEKEQELLDPVKQSKDDYVRFCEEVWRE
jgi:hypothetical protein